VITTVGDLGERLRCARERATVNNHSVMHALVVDAIADRGEGGADFRDAVQTLIANRRAEVSLREMAQPLSRHERNFTPVRGGGLPQLSAEHGETQGTAGAKLESTVRYLGIEVDDALEIAEHTEV
jgi:hypothetical protein